MSQFLYFATGRKTVPVSQLAELGLGHVARSASRETSAGPGGRPGCLFGPCEDLAHKPNQQTWRPLAFSGDDDPSVYVGIWNDRRPTPTDLARDRQLDGVEVQLLDGHSWLVPIMRQWRLTDGDGPPLQHTTPVPRVLDVDGSGRMVDGDVIPRYREVYDAAVVIGDDLFGQLVGSGAGQLEDPQIMRYIGQLIATNYHASITELLLLGCLSQVECRAVVQTSIDFATLRDALGKLHRRQASGATPTEAG